MSRVIKTSAAPPPGDGILTTRFGAGVSEASETRFLSYESLWASTDGAIRDPVQAAREEEERIRLSCETMVREAEARVRKIEKEANDRGFAAGRDEGLKKQEALLAAKAAELDSLIRDVGEERASLYARYETDLLTLVQTLVERLVEHEVSVNPLVISACLKKALGYVVANSTVKVHLHANDFARIRQAGLDNPKLFEGFNRLELVEDPAIAEGGCLLETDFGEVDATLETRKERLYRAIDQSLLNALAGKA